MRKKKGKEEKSVSALFKSPENKEAKGRKEEAGKVVIADLFESVVGRK